jgi:AcrR family transcriptional regulator
MTSSGEPRRRRKSPGERAAEIDGAARAIALEAGLGAVTLRAVAERAGVAPSLVAHYRRSMDELVAATFAGLAGEELAEVAGLVGAAGGGSAVEGLRRLIDAVTAPSRVGLSALWADAWSLGRRNDALAAATRASMDAWHGLASEVLRSGVASGEFRTADVAGVASLFFAVVDATAAYDLVGYRSREQGAALIRATLERVTALPPATLTHP